MSTYIGARYVPKFMGTYDATQSYENMCVVDNGMGTSYISTKMVPAGTPLTDTDYWAIYGVTSGAIINLQNQIDTLNTTTNTIINFTDSYLNVREYGAAGDGVTDDTLAVKAAISDMQSTRKPLFFPDGDYLITEMIIIDTADSTFFNIFGVSDRKSILRADFAYDGTNIALFKVIRSSGTSTLHDVMISDLTIINPDASHNIDAFNITYLNRMVMKNVLFREFRTAIRATMAWSVIIENVRCVDYPGNNGGEPYILLGSQCNNWAFRSCSFSQSQAHQAGVYTNSNVLLNAESANIEFDSCEFEYGRGISVTNTNLTVPIKNLLLLNCYFEWMSRSCLYTEGLIDGITVIGCYCNMVTDGHSLINYAFRNQPGSHDITYMNCEAVNFSSLISLDGLNPEEYVTVINCNGDGTIPIFSGGVRSQFINSMNTAPSAGYHQQGEFIWNNIPTGATPTIGWVCTATGTPGTWVPLVVS